METAIITLINWSLATAYGPYVLAFLGTVGGVVTAASFIVPLTKTTEDDKIVSKAKALLDRFSIFEPKK